MTPLSLGEHRVKVVGQVSGQHVVADVANHNSLKTLIFLLIDFSNSDGMMCLSAAMQLLNHFP